MSCHSLQFALLLCALGGACHKSRSSSDAPLLASSRIGPEGGVLTVDGGEQRGLILTVDPGVLAETVNFRVLEVVPMRLPDGAVLSSDGVVASPFRIEPADLVLRQSVTLRVPYRSANIRNTGPGNVELTQVSPYNSRGYDPEAIDVENGWVEVGVKSFGDFAVVVAPFTQNLLDYQPNVGEVATMTGGFALEVAAEPASSPFVDPGAVQWRLTGPQLDESLIFIGGNLVGRRAGNGAWLEVWDEEFSPFQQAGAGFVIPTAGVMQVQAPVGALPIGASVMPFGLYRFEPPVMFDGSLEREVMKLSINVAYSRADLGAGERQLVFWLSPNKGLLQVSVDGVIYDRIL